MDLYTIFIIILIIIFSYIFVRVGEIQFPHRKYHKDKK